MYLLEIKNLTYGYVDGNRKRNILNELSYTFEKGKLYTILGSSGSGKTTLLSLIGALEKIQEGEIYYEGKSIKEIGYTKYRRNYISVVFQQYNLIPYLTGLENVLNIMNITDKDLPKPYEKTALNLLNMLGIVETKAKRSISTLSGGEQQRVAIARALATDVDVIIADEPTGNLDTETEKEIVSIFNKLAKEYNKCIIIVTHSNEVTNYSDISLKLQDGKLIELGNGDQNGER
jgi:putative ABC transport system ATP-binding protein